MELSISHLPDVYDPHIVQWEVLRRLYEANPIEGIKLGYVSSMTAVDVMESVSGKMVLWFSRDLQGGKRSMLIDVFGVIGLSTLRLDDPSVFLTEGISDFLTMKQCFPERNILGFTTMGGIEKANKIVASLFTDIIILADNDSKSSRNAGLMNAQRMREFYKGIGKRVIVEIPEGGAKDMSEQFMAEMQYRNLKNSMGNV